MNELVEELVRELEDIHDSSSDDTHEDCDTIFVHGFITLSLLNEVRELTCLPPIKKGV